MSSRDFRNIVVILHVFFLKLQFLPEHPMMEFSTNVDACLPSCQWLQYFFE